MKTKKAWFIGTNGTITRVNGLEGKELKLKDMYNMLGNGCHTIEHIGLKKGVDMWIDENGKLEGLEMNPVATKYFHACPQFAPEAYRAIGMQPDFIVGNVIITDNTKAGDFIK